MGRHLLTSTEYAAQVARQDTGCAICGDAPKPGDRALAVDHDHTTGQVRGLLCTRCNLGLGFFRDRPELLAAAADYLNAGGLVTLPMHEQHLVVDECPTCLCINHPDRLIEDIDQTVLLGYQCTNCGATWTCWWDVLLIWRGPSTLPPAHDPAHTMPKAGSEAESTLPPCPVSKGRVGTVGTPRATPTTATPERAGSTITRDTPHILAERTPRA